MSNNKLKVVKQFTPEIKSALSKLASSAGKQVKKRYPAIYAAAASFWAHRSTIGEVMEDVLAGAKGRPAPKGGRSLYIDNMSTGTTTESSYKSRLKTRPSKAFTSVMNMGQRLKFETYNNYRATTANVSNAQGVFDMCQNNFSTSAYCVNSAIWPGDSQGYSNTEGVFTALRQMSTGGGNIQSKLYFKNCNVNTVISNATKTSVLVDLYEVVAKHDISSRGLTNVSSGLNTSPASYWINGNAFNALPSDETGTRVTRITPSTLNDKPYTSELFNTYWKVCAVTHIELSVGSSHKHTSSYTLNKVLSGMRFQESAMLAGITRNIMIVVRGMPGFDTASQQVGVAPAQVYVEHELVYTASVIPNSNTITQSSYTSNSAPTVATINLPSSDGPVEFTGATNLDT